MEAVAALSRKYFTDIAHREAAVIDANLGTIASQTKVFASQTLEALEGDYVPPPAERARYKILPAGGLHTTYDNGTTASFYAGGTRVGRREIQKVWNLSRLDPLMIAIKKHNPTIASVYFNTFDDYNRIYPYVDTELQYSRDLKISSYNFYYEADAEHNPSRGSVWTNAYVDPAGHGWLVSSIAPVWRGNTLEGVVGIDVTLNTIIDGLVDLDLPWGGYAVLIDENGGIIALPPAGENDFSLDELTDYGYSKAILQDTIKPEAFNISKRKDTLPLAEAIKRKRQGDIELDLGGPRLASFAIVPQTGWHLVIIAPTQKIYADASALHDRLRLIGYIMLTALFFFYVLFFAFLTRRARVMSRVIAKPIAQISDLIEHFADRRADPKFGGSAVDELDNLGHHLVATRKRLLDAEEEADRQTEIAIKALAGLRKANSEMMSFTRLMSHEIRTPLSIIDGSAQIIERKAEKLTPTDLRERAGRLRRTVARVAEMLTRMVNHFDAIVADAAISDPAQPVDLCSKVRSVAETAIPSDRLQLNLPTACVCDGDGSATLLAAMRDLLNGVAHHMEPDGQVEVTLECHAAFLTAVIASVGVFGLEPRSVENIREKLSATGGSLAIDTSSARTSIIISVPAAVHTVK
jgi:signal transduction histidine kinase